MRQFCTGNKPSINPAYKTCFASFSMLFHCIPRYFLEFIKLSKRHKKSLNSHANYSFPMMKIKHELVLFQP